MTAAAIVWIVNNWKETELNNCVDNTIMLQHFNTIAIQWINLEPSGAEATT